MSKKPTTTPDLLGEVVARLQGLPPREIDRLATVCGVASLTIKNIRDKRPGRLGPSYNVVAALHRELTKQSPTNATAA